MKINKIVGLLVGLILSLLSVILAIKLPPSFGKTQFIVGVDAEELKRCAENEPDKFDLAAYKDAQGNIFCAFFTPDDQVLELLLKLIDYERKAIFLAAFMLTHGKIMERLIAAHKRGVAIEIITDQGCIKSSSGKAINLHKQGLMVYVYIGVASQAKMSNIMHHKFIVFGENGLTNSPLLLTGSLNFTHSALINNQENIVIINCMPIITKFLKQFELLKKRCVSCEHVQGIAYKENNKTSNRKKNLTKKQRAEKVIAA